MSGEQPELLSMPGATVIEIRSTDGACSAIEGAKAALINFGFSVVSDDGAPIGRRVKMQRCLRTATIPEGGAL